MDIQVDTREHKKEWERIKSQFDDLNINYFRSKLFVGDYQSLDNPRLVIDRKKDLGELCGNVCQQHERFRAELIRAKENGIQLIILVEHGGMIKTLGDVYFWDNPRRKQSAKAVNGPALYKSLATIRDKYGVRFEFCEPFHTGRKIVELLGGDPNWKAG